MAWYYGKLRHEGKVIYEIFSSKVRPKQETHEDRYLQVTGPFRSKSEAVSAAPYPAFIALDILKRTASRLERFKERRQRKNMAEYGLPTETAFNAVREVRGSAELTPNEEENLWVAEQTLKRIHRRAMGV